MKDSLIALILTTQLVVILTGSASVCPTGYSLDTAYQLCLANGENVCAQGFRLNPKPACLAANLVVSFRQPCNNQFEFNIASGSCQQPRSCPANKRFGRNCIKDPSFRGGVGQPNFFPISQSATALPSLTQFNFQNFTSNSYSLPAGFQGGSIAISGSATTQGGQSEKGPAGNALSTSGKAVATGSGVNVAISGNATGTAGSSASGPAGNSVVKSGDVNVSGGLMNYGFTGGALGAAGSSTTGIAGNSSVTSGNAYGYGLNNPFGGGNVGLGTGQVISLAGSSTTSNAGLSTGQSGSIFGRAGDSFNNAGGSAFGTSGNVLSISGSSTLGQPGSSSAISGIVDLNGGRSQFGQGGSFNGTSGNTLSISGVGGNGTVGAFSYS
jgi:hypothetical protein